MLLCIPNHALGTTAWELTTGLSFVLEKISPSKVEMHQRRETATKWEQNDLPKSVKTLEMSGMRTKHPFLKMEATGAYVSHQMEVSAPCSS